MTAQWTWRSPPNLNSFSLFCFFCSWSVKLHLSQVFMTQWRVHDMAYSFRTLFLVFLASCDFTVAHVALTYPPARKYDLDFLDNSRTKGPCGMPKGEYSWNVRTLTSVQEPRMNSWMRKFRTRCSGVFCERSLSWSRNYCHFMKAEVPCHIQKNLPLGSPLSPLKPLHIIIPYFYDAFPSFHPVYPHVFQVCKFGTVILYQILVWNDRALWHPTNKLCSRNYVLISLCIKKSFLDQ
jgi:hypothetical protein